MDLTVVVVLVPFCRDPLTLSAISFFFGLGMGISMPLTVILMYERIVEGRAVEPVHGEDEVAVSVAVELERLRRVRKNLGPQSG